MAAKREFYTTNQVAQTLGISPFTIRRYIHLRKLKAVKLEGSYRVRRTDLERFLKAREIETQDELDALDDLEAEHAPGPAPLKKRPSASPAVTHAPAQVADESDPALPPAARNAGPGTARKRRPAPTGKPTSRARKANPPNSQTDAPASNKPKRKTPGPKTRPS